MATYNWYYVCAFIDNGKGSEASASDFMDMYSAGGEL